MWIPICDPGMFVSVYVTRSDALQVFFVCVGVCAHAGVLCVPLLIEARGRLCSLDAVHLVFVFYI